MISVIIPTLNEEKFLPKCLESLKKQEHRNKYEIIIVDNNSKDDTKKIAKKFGVKVVHCLSQGITYARELGVYEASGDIIAQGDADTIYPKNWLTKIEDHFSNHQEIVAVAGRYTYQDPPFWAEGEYLMRNSINMLSMIFFRRPFFVSGANFSFRREAFLKVGGYENNSLSPDQFGIAARLSKVGKILYDRELNVLTSSRRVQKPFLLLVMDIIIHLIKLYGHIFRSFAGILQSIIFQKASAKLNSRKKSVDFSP